MRVQYGRDSTNYQTITKEYSPRKLMPLLLKESDFEGKEIEKYFPIIDSATSGNKNRGSNPIMVVVSIVLCFAEVFLSPRWRWSSFWRMGEISDSPIDCCCSVLVLRMHYKINLAMHACGNPFWMLVGFAFKVC